MTGANSYFRTMTATATVLVLAASLSACFDSKPVTAPSGVKSPPTSTVTVTAAPSGATTTTAPSAATTTGSSGTMLADLRLGRRDDGDRLVLQFTGAAPPYRISRTAGPVADCGSGNPATGPGEFLVLTAEPVAMMDDEGRPAYTGPATVAGPGGAISRAVITCRFEAQLQVAVQLTGNNQRYTDSTLTGPGRIVVDVKN